MPVRLLAGGQHPAERLQPLAGQFAAFDGFVQPAVDRPRVVGAPPRTVAGEGVQVGEGDVDWATLGKQLRELTPASSFIPEIWQGHVNNGEGFFTALDRLEKWL